MLNAARVAAVEPVETVTLQPSESTVSPSLEPSSSSHMPLGAKGPDGAARSDVAGRGTQLFRSCAGVRTP